MGLGLGGSQISIGVYRSFNYPAIEVLLEINHGFSMWLLETSEGEEIQLPG